MHYPDKGGDGQGEVCLGPELLRRDLNDLVALLPGLGVGPTTDVPHPLRRDPCAAPAVDVDGQACQVCLIKSVESCG